MSDILFAADGTILASADLYYSRTWRFTLIWCWAAVLTYMVMATLVSRMPSEERALQMTKHHALMIHGASASAFFTEMCSNLVSAMVQENHAKRQLALLCAVVKFVAAHGDLMIVLGRAGIFYSPTGILVNPNRYAVWAISTPTMILILSKITSLSKLEVATVVVVDLVMILSGYLGSIGVGTVANVNYLISMAAFLYVMRTMSNMTTSAMASHDTPVARRGFWKFGIASAMAKHDLPYARRGLRLTWHGTLFLWSVFPAAWTVARVVPIARVQLVCEYVTIAANFFSKALLSSSVIHGNYHAIAEKDKLAVTRHLSDMRESLSSLQDEHARLVAHKDELQAELSLALRNYHPHAVLDSGTPADQMAQIMDRMRAGIKPTYDDIELVWDAIRTPEHLFTPSHLLEKLQSLTTDADVNRSLAAELTKRVMSVPDERLPALDLANESSRCPSSRCPSSRCSGSQVLEGLFAEDAKDMAEEPGGFASLQEALASILGVPAPPEASTVQEPPLTARQKMKKRVLSTGQLGVPRRGRPSLQLSLDARRRFVDVTYILESDEVDEELIRLSDIRSPPLVPLLEVEHVLATVHCWQFNSFALATASQGRPLSALAYFLFLENGLIDHFCINSRVLVRYLRSVEESYQHNPYHNSTHAADVLHTMHVLVHGGKVAGHRDPLTLMACYLAAIIHDVEHVGCTNDYLVNTRDMLALRYNDRSPLENHHLAAAFSLLNKPENNFLASLSKTEFDWLRKMVIDLVLGTDMKQHFAIISQFNVQHREDSIDDRTGTTMRDSEKLLCLQMALKCADLGHLASKPDVHFKWVKALEDEFFAQGDKERELGLTISPLFDRTKPGVSKSQIGFFDIVAIPAFKAFTGVFPGASPMLKYVLHNYQFWAELGV